MDWLDDEDEYDFDLDDLVGGEDEDMSLGGGLTYGLPHLAEPTPEPSYTQPEPIASNATQPPQQYTQAARQVMQEFIKELAQPKPPSAFSQIAEAYFGTRAMNMPGDPMSKFFFGMKEKKAAAEARQRSELVGLMKSAADEERRQLEYEMKLAKMRADDEDRKEVDFGAYLGGDKRFSGMLIPKGDARKLVLALAGGVKKAEMIGAYLDPLEKQRLTNLELTGEKGALELDLLRNPEKRFTDPAEKADLTYKQNRAQKSYYDMLKSQDSLEDEDDGASLDDLTANQRAIRLEAIKGKLMKTVAPKEAGQPPEAWAMVPSRTGGVGTWKRVETLTESDLRSIAEYAESILESELPSAEKQVAPNALLDYLSRGP